MLYIVKRSRCSYGRIVSIARISLLSISSFVNQAVLCAVFEESDTEVELSSNHNRTLFNPSNADLDYVFRPSEMSQLCLMEYSRCGEKKRNLSDQLFQSLHPQSQSHSVHRRTIPVVVTNISKRLPDNAHRLYVQLNKSYSTSRSLYCLSLFAYKTLIHEMEMVKLNVFAFGGN